MGSNLSWRTEGRLHVCVHNERDPTNVEWQRYVNSSSEHVAKLDVRILILSRGGSPSGDQRRVLMSAIGKRTKPVALLTDNAIARTVVVAMRFFNPTMKAFKTSEVSEASDFLGLTQNERSRAVVLLAELERELAQAG